MALNPRALAVTTMVVAPSRFGAGVTVSARLAPAPPTAILPFGTIAGFDETAVTTTPAAPPMMSPTETPTVTGVFRRVPTLAMSETVGGAFVTIGDAACVTVAVAPPTLTIALRAGPALARTAKLTVPLPLPEPVVIVSHGTFVDPDHGHVDGAVTLSEKVPPSAGTASVPGSEAEHVVLLDVRTRSAQYGQSP